MTNIDLYSMTTVPIEACANGQSLAKATGFIWQDGDQHYLITNWHVVTGRNARTNELTVRAQPDMLRLLFNTKMQDFGKKEYDLKIRDADNRPCWYTHPVRNRGCDVVAVPLPMTAEDIIIINMYPINTLNQKADLAVRNRHGCFYSRLPVRLRPSGFSRMETGKHRFRTGPHPHRRGLHARRHGFPTRDVRRSGHPTQLGSAYHRGGNIATQQYPRHKAHRHLLWPAPHQRPNRRADRDGLARRRHTRSNYREAH